jgi:GTP-binding protein Era
VRGIIVEGLTQIVFVDTPGLFAPKRRLDRAMAAAAWGAAGDADALALLVDAREEIRAAGRHGLAAPNAELREPTRAILKCPSRDFSSHLSRLSAVEKIA